MKKNPCTECPFNKNTKLSRHQALGGAEPEVYVGQIYGPFWLPCHMDKNYKSKESRPDEVTQCAGAAIFRANLGLSEIMPDKMLKLEKHHPDVFESVQEFISYYLDVSIQEAEFLHKLFPPSVWMKAEMEKLEVKFYDSSQKFK